MASRGTVKLLSFAKGRRSGKLLPKTKGRGQQFLRASSLTKWQQIDCSPRSNWINTLLPYLLYNFYKNNVSTLKSDKQHPDHIKAWISQRCLKQPTVTFYFVTGNSSTFSWYKKSERKLEKQLEITDYIYYSRLGNEKRCFA